MHLSGWRGCLIDYRVEGRTLGTGNFRNRRSLCTSQPFFSLCLALIFQHLLRCLPASIRERFALALLDPSLLWGRGHAPTSGQMWEGCVVDLICRGKDGRIAPSPKSPVCWATSKRP